MELALIHWIANHRLPWLDRLLIALTRLGDHGTIWILLCLGLFFFRRSRRAGVQMALALILMFVLGEGILKNLFARPRPYTHLPGLSLLIPPETSWSFPSGHTASSFAAAFSLWFWDRRWGKWALVLACAIGISRIYLSVHYPTDVIGGFLLGMGCAYLARWLLQKWDGRQGQKFGR